MALFKLPLINVPQRFVIELDGRSLILNSKWNQEHLVWELDIYDNVTNQPLIMALPMVTGLDLLYQHQHLIKGSIVCFTEGAGEVPPTLENLGTEGGIYFETVS
jgi:hypothetical protein